ncbi:MAG: Cyclase homology domain / Predicted ATPase / Transcriptional regulator, LuxR family [uncultured Solirubrobacteraceae bacterium]|uniref:Cyclase homology domain / Predicted ATPase / Transcriptional regulator, LuxR family n=1 Tax=uncultured Solirubrobacteraceae bacterium TaxID=1162706 RepID=A0A6J4TUX5_9ACTN|nr:MAG: Cyclase homology domain / Predicted ATPase / Transcriptional regulator, LuxR family [uncultured Solirubrobacteraceae bacterium]
MGERSNGSIRAATTVEISVDRTSAEQFSDIARRRSADARRGSLPEQLTSFVGRSGELARVRELLGEVRLLTLVGAGGCGKTRLAIQSGSDGAAGFPDGVWWVELAALENAELLPSAVTAALGLRDRRGQAPLEVLLEHLRPRRALLVLDNCEHLLGACAKLVDTLLRSCHGLVVLATSREALGVPGESPFRVPSLSLTAESGSLRAVAQSDAATLFVDRAGQANPSFTVTEDNAPAVATICERLGGIPLAIELAAARARVLSAEQIARALDDRFHLLTQGGRMAAPRHQTLRASIDWSHDLCSEPERMLLRRLSVWTGGWTLEGAEAVSAGDGIERRAVLDLLTALIDKSLVETEERAGEIRYGMLETIRQYAAEHLAEAGEVDATRARHMAWCLQLAERAEPELVRHNAGHWMMRLEQEAGNLRTALARAVAGDSDAAVRIASALTFFWLMRGRLEEGAATFARVLEVAPQPSVVRGKVLWGLAYLNIYRAQFETCLKYAKRALADGEAFGDRSVMARALLAQGFIHSLTDHLQRAPLERSLELATEANDEWCRADATRSLAASYVRQSEHDLARPLVEDFYALARALGYRPHYAWYFNMRAWMELDHGRPIAARELAEQAVSLSTEIGEPVTLGLATAMLIECDVLQGLPAQGRARAAPYVEFMRSTGARSAAVWVEGALALADVAEGSPHGARARIEATLALLEGSLAYDQFARARRPLAVALLLLGDVDGAEREAQLLLAHAHVGRNEHVETLARDLLARAALARGAVVEAEGHVHEALAIAARRDFRLQTVNALELLARVAALTDSPAAATRLLAAVHTARADLRTVRWPPQAEVWTGVQEDLRVMLGDDGFAASWEEGLTLPIEEAVGYATRTRGKRRRPARGWESLTPTEVEVVRHAAAGLSNPQIGERMFISRSTVKAHLSHIFAKLGTSSRAELAAEATRRGLDAPGTVDAAPQ